MRSINYEEKCITTLHSLIFSQETASQLSVDDRLNYSTDILIGIHYILVVSFSESKSLYCNYLHILFQTPGFFYQHNINFRHIIISLCLRVLYSTYIGLLNFCCHIHYCHQIQRVVPHRFCPVLVFLLSTAAVFCSTTK